MINRFVIDGETCSRDPSAFEKEILDGWMVGKNLINCRCLTPFQSVAIWTESVGAIAALVDVSSCFVPQKLSFSSTLTLIITRTTIFYLKTEKNWTKSKFWPRKTEILTKNRKISNPKTNKSQFDLNFE